ncbi:MAG TPA: hypothetical protein VFR30_00390, partial [Lysobacter sp.]|nr:hypothetical protein [Lysobacter sp.]
MPRRKTPEDWLEEAKPIFAQLATFNATHPHATWAEIEGAVDGALAGLRRDLIADSVAGHALADFRGASERPRCPHCDTALQADGQRRREVITQGNEGVVIARTAGVCPACGV